MNMAQADPMVTGQGTGGELSYPFGKTPGPGEVIEVADGILWIRMSLPFSLDHINLWALRDGEGWTIVDTGIQDPATAQAWRRIFGEALGGQPVKRVIVTHMHPDHIGMAGWITRRFNCRLWMTRAEYFHCRVLVADTGREPPPEALDFYRRAGWTDEALEFYRTRFGSFGKSIHALPDSYRRLIDGERLRIGDDDWEIVIGTGHSPEHACLYSRGRRLLISGDQVLPRISSNVSVHPTEPDADPLGDWIASLERLRGRIADDVLILPAHNLPFRGLYARLAELSRGHETSLMRLKQALSSPQRAVDVFSALFARPIKDEMLMSLATGESLAHLNRLIRTGEARCTIDPAGVAWYQANFT
jgi:glyoxylase-like metal-dependent hydrolase (beta-lactamase superfamily II)